MNDKWNDKIFRVNRAEFEPLALDIFRFQVKQNPVYKSYTEALNVDPSAVSAFYQIPFLPVQFFKTHSVQSGLFEPRIIFESSGTTGGSNSRHFIRDLTLYEESFTRGFELFYGPVKNKCIIGLLPSYLERGNSSLVYMVDKLVQLSGHSQSGFYLHEYEKLGKLLQELEKQEQPTWLIGVAYALLELANQCPQPLKHTTFVETGGMKGKRKEMVREELHNLLKQAFGVSLIHSEYGMTELLSQAYSKGEGIFRCPPWMRVLVRDEEDPLFLKSGVGSQESVGRRLESGMSHESKGHFLTPDSRLPTLTGAINIIDLANIHSCSFIATDDAGRVHADGNFEVLGRMDNSDLRGCSLLII